MLDQRIILNVLEFLARAPIKGGESEAMTEAKRAVKSLLSVKDIEPKKQESDEDGKSN